MVIEFGIEYLWKVWWKLCDLSLAFSAIKFSTFFVSDLWCVVSFSLNNLFYFKKFHEFINLFAIRFKISSSNKLQSIKFYRHFQFQTLSRITEVRLYSPSENSLIQREEVSIASEIYSNLIFAKLLKALFGAIIQWIQIKATKRN